MAVTIHDEWTEKVLNGKRLALFRNHLTPGRYGCFIFSEQQCDSIDQIFDIIINDTYFRMECFHSDDNAFLEKKEEMQNDNNKWLDISPKDWRTTGDLIRVFNLIAKYIQ